MLSYVASRTIESTIIGVGAGGAFEAAFAIYLIVTGFRPSPILDDARLAGGEDGSLCPAAAP